MSFKKLLEILIEEHILRIKLLPQLEILLQSLLITRPRIILLRSVHSLVNMRDTTMLDGHFAESRAELLPFRVLGVVVLWVDDYHVGILAAG